MSDPTPMPEDFEYLVVGRGLFSIQVDAMISLRHAERVLRKSQELFPTLDWAIYQRLPSPSRAEQGTS